MGSNTRITLCNKVLQLRNFLAGKVRTDRIYRPPIYVDQIVIFTIENTIEKVLGFLMYFGSREEIAGWEPLSVRPIAAPTLHRDASRRSACNSTPIALRDRVFVTGYGWQISREEVCD